MDLMHIHHMSNATTKAAEQMKLKITMTFDVVEATNTKAIFRILKDEIDIVQEQARIDNGATLMVMVDVKTPNTITIIEVHSEVQFADTVAACNNEFWYDELTNAGIEIEDGSVVHAITKF